MTRKCHVRFGGGTVEKRINCGSPPYLPYHEGECIVLRPVEEIETTPLAVRVRRNGNGVHASAGV
jgi:hypothetical protein